MQVFTDTKDRKWEITVDVAALKRVRKHLDVDLLEVASGKLLERFVADPVLLCDVIYVLCQPQAEGKNIDSDDFGRALAGDVIEEATTAFLEALAEFFPLGRRHLLKKAIAKVRELQEKVLKVAEMKLDDPELLKDLERELGPLSGSSPASSESIPAP